MVCMLLLCRQQPSHISDNNSAVVDLKDMTASAAGKSVGRKQIVLFYLDFSAYLDSYTLFQTKPTSSIKHECGLWDVSFWFL